MQVAETFDMESELDDSPSLKGKAFLDNCVTVLDAAEVFINLNSIKSLQARILLDTPPSCPDAGTRSCLCCASATFASPEAEEARQHLYICRKLMQQQMTRMSVT